MRGEPYRAISALELLATAVALALFGPRVGPRRCAEGLVEVTGFTDSQVSSYVVNKGLSTSSPLCLAAMEVAAWQGRSASC